MLQIKDSARIDTPPQVAFVHQSWPADPRQLAPIRAEVHRWLASLGLPEDTEIDIVFAVNEAATNAIKHASATAEDTVELTYWTEGTALCIEVADHGTWQVPPSPELTGRCHGIPVMQQLIESVVIHFDTRGTRVLLRHPIPPECMRDLGRPHRSLG